MIPSDMDKTETPKTGPIAPVSGRLVPLGNPLSHWVPIIGVEEVPSSNLGGPTIFLPRICNRQAPAGVAQWVR